MKSSTCRATSGENGVMMLHNWVTSLVEVLVDRERREREEALKQLQFHVNILHKSVCQHDRIIVELMDNAQKRSDRRAA